MNKILMVFVLIAMMLNGCGQSNGQNFPAPSVEKTATSAPVPKSTVQPLPSPSPAPSSLPTVSRAIERHCPEFMGEVAMESIARGAVFYNDSLVDLQSGQEYEIPLDKTTPILSGGKISPNRKYFSYTTHNQLPSRTIIWVINAKADILIKQSVDYFWYNLRWLDDKRLLFETENTQEQAEAVVFNLETSEVILIANELPGIFTQRDIGLSWRVSYSSDLQKVLYIGRPQPSSAFRPIYRDLISQTTLWEAPIPIEGLGYPRWSPDGQYVALMVNGDLYIIQSDGHIVDILEKSQFGYITTWSYSWSHNGQYVAFWASNNIQHTDTIAKLIVYEIGSQSVIDYCIDGHNNASAPGWSPDSTQIVINSYSGTGGLLLDLPTNRSYKLLDISGVLYPAGWMHSVSGEE